MRYEWNFSNENIALFPEMKKQSFSPPLLHVLQKRGFSKKEDVDTFLDKSIMGIHDPKSLLNIDKAVGRIKKAIDNHEKIMIYGDYDVDGTTAVAVFLTFFKSLNIKPLFYIPHRIKEGYGLSKDAIQKASSNAVDLIITVDTGITNITEVMLANTLGIEVIITDHHIPGSELPEAYAIVNPHLSGCLYPNKALAGVGVAFKVVHACLRELSFDELTSKKILRNLLDYVTLGTIADQVSLIGENRRLVATGLKQISKSSFPGVRIMMDALECTNSVCNAKTISFKVTPKLNASGRMNHSNVSVKLLVEEDPLICRDLFAQIESFNSERQSIEEENLQIAMKLVSMDKNFKNDRIIVLHHSSFHPGVNGIIASRLTDKFHRPAIILSVNSDDQLIGSARSIALINIYECLDHCKDLLVAFGGHDFAAGLKVDLKNIDALKIKLNSYIKECHPKKNPPPFIDIEACVDFSEITPSFIDDLKMLEPFGHGNRSPVFITRKAVLRSKPKVLKGKHVKFYLAQGDYSFDVIGFNFAEEVISYIKANDKIDIIYHISINSWLGQESVQLEMLDFRKIGKN